VFGAAEIMAARVSELRGRGRLPKAFSVREAKPADRPMLDAFIDNPARAAKLLSSGDVGLLALAEERVQAMEWARLGPADYDWDERRLGLVFSVPQRYCWLHNGSGGQNGALGPWAMILGFLPGFLRERGVEAACLQVASDNPYSVRCHESLGFRKVGRVVALQIGRLRLVWLRLKGEKWTRLREERLDLQRLAI
jgi:hypothetical protein